MGFTLLDRLVKSLTAGLIIGLFSGCAVHNAPSTQRPNSVLDNRFVAHVDQLGTFYPAGWASELGEPTRFYGFYLDALAVQRNKTEYLAQEQSRALRDFQEYTAAKRKVVILIHGFNASVDDSTKAFKEIEDAIIKDDQTAFIHFFWDGLVSKVPILGDMKIWFNAAGNSHLAGTRGLRTLLANLADKDVFIVTHSRGAHVALSALSEPRVSETFVKDTNEILKRNWFASPPLPDNSNRIRLLMLAPAIGRVDLLDAKQPSFRSFGPRVVRIRHTVNPNDPVLRKYLAAISDNFNATDFGYSARVSVEAQRSIPVLSHIEVQRPEAHGFIHYVSQPYLRDLLASIDLPTTPATSP